MVIEGYFQKNHINLDNADKELIDKYIKIQLEEDKHINNKRIELEKQVENINDLINDKHTYVENIRQVKDNVSYKRNVMILTLILLLLLILFYIRMNR